MTIHAYFVSDFVEIQRKSFYKLLEKGLIEEFAKRNAITNTKKDLELFFYPQYYKLTAPSYTPREAILKSKSYSSRLYLPVQLTDRTSQIIKLKWVYIGNLPLMTKRGHFILNGTARVVVNQMIRSPGIYYQTKIYENYATKWSKKPDTTYKRYYADLICQRGAWLRIEIDKDKKIWAQLKKGPKIPIMWLLIAMGLTEKIIFKSVTEATRLLWNFTPTNSQRLTVSKNPNTHQTSRIDDWLQNQSNQQNRETSDTVSQSQSQQLTNLPSSSSLPNSPNSPSYVYVKTPPEAWCQIYNLFFSNGKKNTKKRVSEKKKQSELSLNKIHQKKHTTIKKLNNLLDSNKKKTFIKQTNNLMLGWAGTTPPFVNKMTLRPHFLWQKRFGGLRTKTKKSLLVSSKKNLEKVVLFGTHPQHKQKPKKSSSSAELGRLWVFNKFMNPRTYDLGSQGRLSINRKFGLSFLVSQCTLTPQDLLFATDYLLQVEKGLKKIDDIDHLKNRRVRTSGELIQIQLGTGLVRLEKIIRDKLNKISSQMTFKLATNHLVKDKQRSAVTKAEDFNQTSEKQKKNGSARKAALSARKQSPTLKTLPKGSYVLEKLTISDLINTKAFNGALREFFGSSPLSQFMDQINPLSELTHKRRLSSMGPGGVTRDNATLAIRGIHPTHYGRICPVETPEGKNTGLVNSITTYARVNPQGLIETPFYKVYKAQVQKKTGMFFFSAEAEEKIKLAAADLFVSKIGFLPKAKIPVRIAEEFTKIPPETVEYIGVSAVQMISIATSLIPFLEHDDANRALMGSNMQRQAVPLIRPERPLVGTGLEARAVSDSGHVIQAKQSGFVCYVSAQKIIIFCAEFFSSLKYAK